MWQLILNTNFILITFFFHVNIMFCKMCNCKSLKTVESFLRHIRQNHNLEHEYLCPYENCLQIFLGYQSFKKHILVCFKIREEPSTLENTTQYNLIKKNPVANTEKLSANNKIVEKINVTINPVASTEKLSTNNEIVKKINVTSTVDKTKINYTKFVSSLYANGTISKDSVNDILSNVEIFTQAVTDGIKQKLFQTIPAEYHEQIANAFNIELFENMESDYLRIKCFKELKTYIEPTPFLIGESRGYKKINGKMEWTVEKHNGYRVSMSSVLKMFLQLPNVLDTIVNYMKHETSKKNKRVYSSIFSGSRWKDISSIKELEGKLVLPLMLYHDDFEVCDPLSPTAGKHKIGGTYFSIGGLPPKFSSSLDSIFLAQFILTRDHKKFKNPNCFRKLIAELKQLFTEGVSVTVVQKTTQVFFVLFTILGDNLGMNNLLGLNESFISDYYCRFCRATKYNAYRLCIEKPELLRNLSNYDSDVQTRSHGIKTICIFHELPYYHFILCPSSDKQHDWFSGICRSVMAKVFNNFINEKNYFSLHQLNYRLKTFDSDKVDRGNQVTYINPNHIKNGLIILTSAQMSFLITYLGIIVGDLIPRDDPVWQLYLTLYDVINFITASSISEEEVRHLEKLITSHHEMYLKLFGEDLKPKFHLATHTGQCIRAMGPLSNISCEKYERFHQKPKKNGRNINNRICMTSSLASKVQLQLSEKLINEKGLNDTIAFGPCTSIKKSISFSSQSYPASEVSYCTVNGTDYKPGYGIVVRMNNENNPVIGVITRLFETSNSSLIIAYKECLTYGLDNHVKGYVLSMPFKYATEKYILNTLNCYYKPFHIKKNARMDYIVSMRDLS